MIGNQIGNFRVIEKLGEGGMGVVYKAEDVTLGRLVAIKMLNTDLARNPELVQRFQSEARAQANLNHTNLATLYAFLIDQGNAFMVMEFVEGENFDQIIRRGGPMNPRDAVPWFKQALLGIGAAHRMGIIHRDIKPSNLMLNRQGIVKVMDFGIAKAVGTRGMTRTGMQLGTLAYMSPEQIQNRNVDVRSDIYALGVTLYEMLSGHVPFESDSDFQVMHDHVTTPPPPLTRYYPYAPREFEAVVGKALAKNPDERFQTVEEFGAALEHPERVSAPAPPMVAAPPSRGTVVEGIPTTAWQAGAAAAPAPAVTNAPPPPPGTSPAATAPGVAPTIAAAGVGGSPIGVPAQTPPPQPAKSSRISGKMIAAVCGVAIVGVLAVVFWPKSSPGPTPGPGPGPGPGPAPTQSRNLQQEKADIVVATGGGDQPAASTPTPASAPTPRRNVGDQSQREKQRVQTAQNEPPQNQPTPQSQPTQQYQPTPPPTPAPTPPPTPQPQRQASAQTFMVRHRHVYGSYVYYCAGVLAVSADGRVAYACGATNDPQRRCEQVVFPAGSIHQLKLKGGGELHIGTQGMGNWDFYDYNVAGSTASAYQAILPFAR